MKIIRYTLIIALIIFTLTACNNDGVAISITDNGKTLRLKVKVEDAEKSIHYDKSFDVKGMNDRKKKKLTNHILDSLGVKN